jgi:hypothetical protein
MYSNATFSTINNLFFKEYIIGGVYGFRGIYPIIIIFIGFIILLIARCLTKNPMTHILYTKSKVNYKG